MSDRSNKQNTYTLRSLYVSQTHPPLRERYPPHRFNASLPPSNLTLCLSLQ